MNAIGAYEEVLKILSIERYPLKYAIALNNLGTAYEMLARVRNMEENLTKAIGAYEEALEIITVEQYPADFASVQNNLGNAYITFAEVRNKEKNLNKAIRIYKEALKIYTIDKYPFYYAFTRNNLRNAHATFFEVQYKGSIYSEIRIKEENLKKAVLEYEEALKVYTIEQYPLNYALTQNNLENAYWSLAEVIPPGIIKTQRFVDYQSEESLIFKRAVNEDEVKIKNITNAINAYEEALKIYTAGEHPLDYAQTQNNLGAAYKTLAEFQNPGENLLKAIGIYEEALKIRTIDKYPLDYAHTQNNLGTTYRLLSTVHNMEENITKSRQAFDEALKIFTLENYPLLHQRIVSNLMVIEKN